MNLKKVEDYTRIMHDGAYPGMMIHTAIIYWCEGDSEVMCVLDEKPVCPAEMAVNEFAGVVGNSIECEGYREGSFVKSREYNINEIVNSNPNYFTMNTELAKMLLLMKATASIAFDKMKDKEEVAFIIQYDNDSDECFYFDFSNEADINQWAIDYGVDDMIEEDEE